MILLTLLLIPVTYCTEYKVGVLVGSNDPKTVLQEVTTDAATRLNKAAGGSDPTISVITASYKEGSVVNLVNNVCSLVNDKVVAVISLDDSTDTKTLADILTPLHLPLLSLAASDPFLKDGNRDYLMSMTPSDIHQSKAIYELLNHFKWMNVAILASVDDYGVNGLIHLQDLIIVDGKMDLTNILYFKSESGSVDVAEQLDVIAYSLTTVIVLNCQAEQGRAVLESAKDRGLLGEGMVWILTDSISTSPEVLQKNGVYPSYYDGLIGVVPAFEKSNTYKTWRDSFLMGSGITTKDKDLNPYVLNAYDAVGIVSKALKTAGSLAQPSVNCNSAASWSAGSSFLQKLRDTSYTGITGNHKFNEDGETQKIAYNIVNFKDNVFSRVMSWSSSSGLTVTGEQIVYLGGGTTTPSGTPNTLNGRHLKLGVTTEPPFMWKNEEDCKGDECWYGYIVDYIAEVSKDLNFTFSYIEPADKSFGGYNKETGLWSGLIGDLIAGKTDLIMMDLSISSERQNAIDFLFPFMDSAIRAVVLASSGTSNPFFFLNPFDISVWLTLIGAILLTTLVLNFFDKYSPFGIYGKKMHAMQVCSCDTCATLRYKKKLTGQTFLDMKRFECCVEETEDSEPLEDLSVNNSLWMVGAGFVGQGGDVLPSSQSGRFLLFSWWFFIMLITSMYTANLTAFITLSNMGVSLSEVKDVVDQKEYGWGVITQRYPESLLLNHIDTAYHDVVKQGEKLKSLDEALDRVRTSKFVFIDEAPVLQYNLKESCDIFSVGSEFQSFEYAFGIAQNSPYEDLLNAHILKYRELGRFEKLWATWAGDSALCKAQKVGSESTLSIMNVIGIFYFLCIGIGISSAIAILETILAAYKDPPVGKYTSFFSKLALRLKLKGRDIRDEWWGLRRRKVGTPVLSKMGTEEFSNNPASTTMQVTPEDVTTGSSDISSNGTEGKDWSSNRLVV